MKKKRVLNALTNNTLQQNQDCKNLIKAIKDENLDEIRSIFSKTQNKMALLSVVNEDGCSPLHIAISQYSGIECSDDNVELVKILLQEAGKNVHKLLLAVNKNGSTALHLATSYRVDYISIKIIKALLNAGKKYISKMMSAVDSDYDTVLHCVVANDELNLSLVMLEVLLKKCAVFDIVNAIIKVNKDGNTPLHLAADKEAAESLALMLNILDDQAKDQLCRTNKNGNTPLHLAADKGADESLTLILDVLGDKAKDQLCKINKNGDTPLHLAGYNDVGEYYPKTIELLINKAGDKVQDFILKTNLRGDNILHLILRSVIIEQNYDDESDYNIIKLITESAGSYAAQLITQENSWYEKPLLMALPIKNIMQVFMCYNHSITHEESIAIQARLNNSTEIIYESYSLHIEANNIPTELNTTYTNCTDDYSLSIVSSDIRVEISGDQDNNI